VAWVVVDEVDEVAAEVAADAAAVVEGTPVVAAVVFELVAATP
jgi:hypothetical protein